MDAEEEENIDDIFVEIWIKIWRYGLSDIDMNYLMNLQVNLNNNGT